MAFQYNTAQANVTISGAVVTAPPVAAANQTFVAKSGSTGGGNTSTTLHTVTGGKTFYLQSVALDAAIAAGTAHAQVTHRILDNVTQKHVHVQVTNEVGRQLVFPTPIAFSTSVVHNGSATAGGDPVHWSIQGFEQ